MNAVVIDADCALLCGDLTAPRFVPDSENLPHGRPSMLRIYTLCLAGIIGLGLGTAGCSGSSHPQVLLNYTGMPG